jgi:hypothetical protein
VQAGVDEEEEELPQLAIKMAIATRQGSHKNRTNLHVDAFLNIAAAISHLA